MKITQFSISTDPASFMYLVHDDEKIGAFVRVVNRPFTFELQSFLLSVIQGLYFEHDDERICYLPATSIPGTKKSIRVPQKIAIDLTWNEMLRDHMIARSLESSPEKIITRYRFAFQQDFPVALHGATHGRALCILEHMGLKELMCIRTPFRQYLFSCKDTHHDVASVLVVPCTRYKEIIRCPCMHWGKTLMDRVDFIACVSDEPEDRWRGFHWIPKSAILEQKVISTLGYPGKSEFALQTQNTNLSLWTDPYMVKF